MTREEAIKYLKVIWNRYKAEYEIERETLDAYHMAIEALQAEPTKTVPPSLADVYKWERDIALAQLEEYGIRFAEKKRDDLVEVVRWIPCSERLPDIEQDVLATTTLFDIREVTFAWRINDGKWFIREGSVEATNNDILAWMPLPTPYREDGE